MDKLSRNYNYSSIEIHEEEDTGLKRGPWTLEEDLLLINYVTNYGEGRWNYLACTSGLNRTGKSCRLRWLNYLRPDVRRGNITLEEQLTILQLHSSWGNRWSKIAQHLPGRTDNEIKNYWRTRVGKHAKQMGCDVDSKLFKDTMRYIWIPRLVEKIQAAAAAAATTTTTSSSNTTTTSATNHMLHGCNNANVDTNLTSENSCMEASSETHVSGDYYNEFQAESSNSFATQTTQIECFEESLTSPSGYFSQGFEFQDVEQNSTWVGTDDLWGNFV